MKFRKWLFKLITGYDSVEYQEILQFAARVNKSGQEVLELAESIHNDNKEIIDLNERVLAASQQALDEAHKVIENCRAMLTLDKEVSVNETVD